jgi:hypothetical protein
LKKTASMFVILVISMTLFVLISSSIRTVRADGGYDIEHVDHRIEVMYNGYVLMNDTIKLNITGQAPNDFLIGFPDKYGSHVLKCVAYSGSDSFPVTLNTILANRVGFYGARIEFPQGAPQVFMVVFVLSNDLITQNADDASLFTLDFPAYPSLTKRVAICNGSIVLPLGTTYAGGTVSGFVYGQENLQEFAYFPASLSFSSFEEKIQIVDVTELDREIRLSEFGEIEGADTYEIMNRALKEVIYFEVFLPPNATDPSAENQFGMKMGEPQQTDTNRYNITFALAIKNGLSSKFTVKYRLPSEFLTQKDVGTFALNLSLFQNENYYINEASITFILPEGARILNLENNLAQNVNSMSRSVFQETVTVGRQGVVGFDNLIIAITYQYNPLWLSFRPTTWVWTLAIVGCIVGAVVWKRPKVTAARVSVPPAAAVRLRTEHLKAFVDAYEEKKKIDLEMESLEARVQKGKIPRRRYKVRKKMLETRLNTLSRDLEEFKEKMRAAGGQYGGLMVQLEVAETEINEVAANIKNAEALHNQGELSLEAYRNRLAENERKKENARSTIDGILLRLREETR